MDAVVITTDTLKPPGQSDLQQIPLTTLIDNQQRRLFPGLKSS